jgi:hypothetical protein
MISLGSISCHPTVSCFSRWKAEAAPFKSSKASRSKRAIVEAHSTCDPHHTNRSESPRASDCSDWVRHEQRHNRRSVPELHRPARRSSMSAPTADALELGGGEVKTAAGATVRRGSKTPSRISRSNRPLGPPSSPRAIGSSRATGRPRSTIKIALPPLRPPIRALRPFLVWVILALFIEPK